MELRRLVAARADFPPVLLVHPASKAAGDSFFERFWPEARAVSDENSSIRSGFEVGRGGLGQLLGPAVWWRGLRALLRGHGVGVPRGDTRLMPGWFLVRGDRILWEYRSRSSADHPDFLTLADTLRQAAADAA